MKLKRLLYVNILLITCLLIFSLYQMYVVTSVKAALYHVQNELQNTQSELSYLHSELYTIREETKWLSYTDFTAAYPETYGPPVTITISWSFSENESESSVFLRSRAVGESEWHTVDAIQSDELFYKASFDVLPNLEYEYQVVSKGAMTRSSDIDYVPTDLYRPQPLTMEFSSYTHTNNDIISAYEAAFSLPANQPDYFKATKAQAIVTDKGGEISKVPLTKNKNGNLEEWKLQISGLQIREIKLEVTYGNGKKHTRMIYPYEDYEFDHFYD
ncbi:hypothetical protein M3689_12240 [Alkalihalophilus marmarensis]|jgi:hypothetical protein|uniref:Uncharacterized protein n=1 Tax=Alkalihalophilus marmarensis DSM 21297 TaxID=1188261 RepID=U6SS19_9BACI|nr:hypothetical protein [Alkalihalophilus marmarensis]ERN53715.1 hypothetical protein A33I_10940 [Alkalihalophilus marmarensis DSM 21297]MCM3490081.1 hypothetical protein [Alkalihalophilus marmarensis]